MADLTPEEIRQIQQEFSGAVRQSQAIAEAEGGMAQSAPAGPEHFAMNERSSVGHVIGVVSGKGGVGKSMVTGVLATNLLRAGKRVGILDADITGPSIPKMFGLSGATLTAEGEMIVPACARSGIKIVSANLLLANDDDPIVWRGPLLAGAIKQFWSDTIWGDIDYLLVDMPPGTGDVVLTVFQSLPVDGIVIVSSPQDLVQMVVGKALRMAEQMSVPVLGMIENMSYATCPDCGGKIEVFGPSHLASTCEHYGIHALGRLPIDPKFASIADTGTVAEALPEGLIPEATEAIEAIG